MIVGFLDGWPLGFLPPVIAAFSFGHAVYERLAPNASRSIGLALDTLVIAFGGWTLGSDQVIVGYGMMVVVITAYFTTGRPRTALFSLNAACIALALSFEFPIAWLDPSAKSTIARGMTIHSVLAVTFILTIAANELRRSEVQRGYVVGTVAHELRNDLTPVVGLSTLLLDELTTMGRSDLAELAGIVTAQALGASDTVDDLLTLARIDREALGLTLGPIDLKGAVAEVVDRYGFGRMDSQHDLRHLEAVGDPVRVKQIVRNLCTNAERYGGDRVELRLELDANGNSHVLVRDNGQGIDESDVAAIFEPFGRGSAGRANQASVGLGLWLSRQLARAMDGELTYRREDGWTVFDLRLPSGEAPTSRLPESLLAG